MADRPARPEEAPKPGFEWSWDKDKKKWVQRDLAAQDPLSKQELAQEYGFALRVIYSNPELRRLFEKALDAEDGQWTEKRFQAKLQETKWWRQNSEYARKAWAAQKTGGADWYTKGEGGSGSLNTAENTIRTRATALGVKVSDVQLRELALRFLYEGWFDASRSNLLDRALAKYYTRKDYGDGTGQGGENTDRTDKLKQLAWEYGVNPGDQWFIKANKSIMRGEATLETWMADLKQRASSRYKPIADAIGTGQTTREALSEYLGSMSEILEIDDKDINLRDPLIQKALGGNPDGSLMTVYDFQRELRKDARWANTGNGRRTTADMMTNFLRDMGVTS